MANVQKIQKSVAVRVWNWVSPRVNHPMMCAPSDWLMGRLSESLSADQISDEVWKIARRSLAMQFPGLDRPLGSCYHPIVADILDVAYHYGMATQRVLRKVASAAAVVATSQRELWTMFVPEKDDDYGQFKAGEVFYHPPTEKHGTKHIELCPIFLGKLAGAVREGRAPELPNISPSFFEDGWDARISEMRRVDSEVRARFVSYIELFTELGVGAYSFRQTIDAKCEHGGNLCNHSTSNGNYWVDLSHDGEMETIQHAPLVESHGNQYHIGCYAGPAQVRIHGASFLITKRTELWPAGHIPTLSVVATPSATVEELRERLTNWKSGTARPAKQGAWNFLR